MMVRVRWGARLQRSKNAWVAWRTASMLANSSPWVTSRRYCRHSVSIGFSHRAQQTDRSVCAAARVSRRARGGTAAEEAQAPAGQGLSQEGGREAGARAPGARQHRGQRRPVLLGGGRQGRLRSCPDGDRLGPTGGALGAVQGGQHGPQQHQDGAGRDLPSCQPGPRPALSHELRPCRAFWRGLLRSRIGRLLTPDGASTAASSSTACSCASFTAPPAPSRCPIACSLPNENEG